MKKACPLIVVTMLAFCNPYSARAVTREKNFITASDEGIFLTELIDLTLTRQCYFFKVRE